MLKLHVYDIKEHECVRKEYDRDCEEVVPKIVQEVIGLLAHVRFYRSYHMGKKPKSGSKLDTLKIVQLPS